MVTDPIADLLTRIRNGLTAKHEKVEVPASKMKEKICEILVSEGYIKSAEVVAGEKGNNIVITLKYGVKNEKVISSLQRISKPGLRVYCGSEDIPQVLNGLGTVILSTSKGVITGKVAKQLNVGGEVLAYVW